MDGFNIFDISMIFKMDMQRYVNFNMIVSCLSWASQNVRAKLKTDHLTLLNIFGTVPAHAGRMKPLLT